MNTVRATARKNRKEGKGPARRSWRKATVARRVAGGTPAVPARAGTFSPHEKEQAGGTPAVPAGRNALAARKRTGGRDARGPSQGPIARQRTSNRFRMDFMKLTPG